MNGSEVWVKMHKIESHKEIGSGLLDTLPLSFNDLRDRGDIVIESDCDGACCKSIYLPVSPEELRRSYMWWRYCVGPMRGIEPPMSLEKRNNLYADIELIYPNFEFVRETRFWYDSEKHPAEGGRVWIYRCHQSCDHRKTCLLSRRPMVCTVHPSRHTFYRCYYPGCKLRFRFKNKRTGFLLFLKLLKSERLKRRRSGDLGWKQ